MKSVLSWSMVGIILGLMFIAPAICMWLWNWLMPAIFGLPTIGYLQALGLIILSRILVGTGISSSND